MNRRAFIMPLVLMLTVVLSLAAVYIVQRQSVQYLTTRRQVAQYEAHHTTQGLKDIVNAWLKTGRYRTFRERIDAEGRIVDIVVPDGLTSRSPGGDIIRLSVKDAQGTLRADFDGLQGQTLRDAKAALDALKTEAPDSWRTLTRQYGPITVSIAEAKREVLAAVVQSVTDSVHDGQGFVTSVLDMQSKGPIDAQAFSQAMLDAQLSPEQQAKLSRMVTSETTFWALTVDVLRGGTTVVARYEGFLTSSTNRSNARQNPRQNSVTELRRIPIQ